MNTVLDHAKKSIRGRLQEKNGHRFMDREIDFAAQNWLIDIDGGWDVRKGEGFRPYSGLLQPELCPCLLYNRPKGFWITSRGRRLTARETLRIQGFDVE